MSLLDDVIVSAAAAVDAVEKKAEKVVERSKIRVSSAELKKKISDKFEILGRYVYDTRMTNSTDEEVVRLYASEITELIDELKSLQDALNTSGYRLTCPKCSCVNASDSLYCKKCGASLDFTNSYTSPEKSKNDEAAVKAEPAASVAPEVPTEKENTVVNAKENDSETSTDNNI